MGIIFGLFEQLIEINEKIMSEKEKQNFISGNSRVVRNINRAVVLNIIREKQPISRVSIARLTRLNKSTVSSIVAGLLQENLISEEVNADRNVGRNPYNLSINSKGHYVGAVNMDSSLTHIAVFTIDGNMVEATSMVTQPQQGKAFIARCLEKLADLQQKNSIGQLAGLGVSVGGIVDSIRAQVRYAPNLGWQNLELGQLIREINPHIGILSIENDAKASALAELWFGRFRSQLGEFIFLSVGVGLGTGIVVGKKLLAGENFAAGEFGHITLFENGEPCACGDRGCWEAYACDRATVARYYKHKGVKPDVIPAVSLQDIIGFAFGGDAVARKVLLQTGYYLGLGISTIIKTVDPGMIILGGKLAQAWDIIYPEIVRTVERKTFSGRAKKINLQPSSLKESPRLVGAATLAIKEIFSDFRITV